MGWVDAFNARDLDAMLACLDADVDFHPLKLLGLDGHYRGHDGVRTWLGQLDQLRDEYRISISNTRRGDDDQVLAEGVLSAGAIANLGPFCGVHRVADGVIVAARHYLSSAKTLEQIGLFQ